MAGSGIRSVRVANEIENIAVIINDRNPQAVDLINENVKQLQLEKKSQVYSDDANELMLRFGAVGDFLNDSTSGT
ncbi:tRNA (guanine(26)-N(2))-dimethyltransferase [subsurface metagenome]